MPKIVLYLGYSVLFRLSFCSLCCKQGKCCLLGPLFYVLLILVAVYSVFWLF